MRKWKDPGEETVSWLKAEKEGWQWSTIPLTGPRMGTKSPEEMQVVFFRCHKQGKIR